MHADAFRDLQMSLRDCIGMGELVVNVACGQIPESMVSFAVHHLGEMLMRLEKEYDTPLARGAPMVKRRRATAVSWVTHRRRLRR